MKLWVVKSKNYKLAPLNMAFAITEDTGPASTVVKSVHLFTLRKHADAYCERMNKPYSYLEVVPVEVTPR